MKSRRGFSLIELALVLGISGLMVGFVLQSQQSAATEDCYLATQLELKDINGAIQNFARKNERLPMPAARDVGVEGVTYGRETVAANLDVAGTTTWGALPFQALGLAPSYASDCWGNKLTYVVTTALTTNATSGGYLDSTVIGTITVKKDATTNSSTTAAYAVISHGEDKLGAVKSNYSNTASHGWCTGAASLATQNCLATSATVADATFNNGRDAGNAFFDDVIITSGRPEILSSTNLYCWGTDQLGTGILADNSFVASHSTYAPKIATTNIKFAKLTDTNVAGTSTPCALASDGTAYCWGDNSQGAIGDGTTNNRAVPTAVGPPSKFKNIYQMGAPNTVSTHCGIAMDDTVWCWGGNGSGANTYLPWPSFAASNPSPIQLSSTITFSKLVSSPTANAMCGLAISGPKPGQVYCWGSGADNHLGQGPAAFSSSSNTPVLASGTRYFSDIAGLTPICGLTSADDPGGAGKIYCWGKGYNFSSVGEFGNSLGALGLAPLTITNITNANPGIITYTPGTYTLGAGDEVWVQNVNGMGGINYQKFGVLANSGLPLNYTDATTSPAAPPYTIRLAPSNTSTSANFSTAGYSAYTGGGQMVVLGRNVPTMVDGVAGVTFTKLVSNNSAISSTGQLYTWGTNTYNELGNGSSANASASYVLSSITNANPTVVTTTTAHGFAAGDVVHFINAALATVTAQGGGNASITLSANDSPTSNAYTNETISIVSGTGTGQTRTITGYNNATKVATISGQWLTPPDTSSVYRITPAWTARATGTTSTSLGLNVKSSQATNFYMGKTITITAGTGAGQTRTVTGSSYDGVKVTATISPAWSVIPNATSTYTLDASAAPQSATNPFIILNAASNSTSGYYNGLVVGSSNGAYLNTILSYNGVTKTAIVSSPWSSAPTSGTPYTIGLPVPGYYKVASPTSTTFALQNMDGTSYDTSKFSTFVFTGRVTKIPVDGSCAAANKGYVSNCSYTPVPAAQSSPSAFTFSDVSPFSQPRVGFSSAGVKVWGKTTISPPLYVMGNGVVSGAGVELTTPTNISSTNLGGDTLISPVYQGIGTVCALSTTGKVYCWGSNTYGALGSGNTADIDRPTPVNTSLLFTGLLPLTVSSDVSTGMCGLTP